MKNQFEEDTYKALVKRFGVNNVRYEAEEFLYTTEHLYTPDFTVYADDSVFCVESKGYLRPDHRRTLAAVRSQHPKLDLRLLFQKDQRVSKGAKMKYSDWAERYGFQYAVGLKNIKEIF